LRCQRNRTGETLAHRPRTTSGRQRTAHNPVAG
jgi:hypothetical protein